MGWPGLGFWRGLTRRFRLACLAPRPLWRRDEALEGEVLAQLLERGE
jgi:hypothetical protein